MSPAPPPNAGHTAGERAVAYALAANVRRIERVMSGSFSTTLMRDDAKRLAAEAAELATELEAML